MRSIALVALAVPLIVAGCAVTPRQKCEAPYRAELRNVEADIHDSKLNLARGFVLVPARTTTGLHFCVRPSGAVLMCTAEDGDPMYDKRAVNRAAEQAKLAALRSQVPDLKASIAACQAQYPE